MHIRRITGLFVLSLITAFFLSACGGGGGGGSAPDLSPLATTLPASSITSNGAVLSAIVNPKGLSTTAGFEYSKDPALVSNVTTTAPQALGSGSTDDAINQIITGLESGQTYSFRVVATNSVGTKNGAIFTLSTLPLPTTNTNPADSITTTGATLHAIVNPNGRQTFAWFEYGETPALGTSIDNQLRGSGTDNVSVSTTLTGLKPATQYSYRIVATSSAGTSNGTILNFTTAGGVPLVTTKSAISITTTGGVLRADVNPSGLATNAWFEYGTDNTFTTFATTDNQAIPAGTITVGITFTLSGQSSATTIYYRVAASNIVGASLKGDAFTFITAGGVPLVTTRSATSVTTTGGVFHADVNPSALATIAWFEFGTDNTFSSFTTTDNQAIPAGTSAVGITFPLSGRSPGETIYYRVAASNIVGLSLKGETFSFTTTGGVPLVTTNSADSITTTGGVLHADVNPNSLATIAWFEFGTDNTFSSFTTTDNQAIPAGASAVGITATLSGRSLGETIYYRVAASNIEGPSLKGEVLSFTTQNPPPTANAGTDQSVFTRSATGATVVTLDASGSSADPLKEITSYAWTQLSGIPVALDNSDSPTPSFFAPQFAYGPSQDLVFGVTATDNAGLSGTDNVLVTVNWGYFDDFRTDTTATYSVTENPNPNSGGLAYDAPNGEAQVTTGVGNTIFISHLYSFGAGNSSNQGVFSMDFFPTQDYGAGAGAAISIGDSGATYIRISTLSGEDVVEKYRAGVLIDSKPLTGNPTLNTNNPIRITFTRSVTTVEAFGQTVTLGGGDQPIPMSYFGVQTRELDANYDNFKLEIHP